MMALRLALKKFEEPLPLTPRACGHGHIGKMFTRPGLVVFRAGAMLAASEMTSPQWSRHITAPAAGPRWRIDHDTGRNTGLTPRMYGGLSMVRSGKSAHDGRGRGHRDEEIGEIV